MIHPIAVRGTENTCAISGKEGTDANVVTTDKEAIKPKNMYKKIVSVIGTLSKTGYTSITLEDLAKKIHI